MTKYWETEKPVIVTTSKNVLEYYKQAGKLSVSRPNWLDDNGKEHRGKTVTIDISALSEDREAALSMFADIMGVL